MPKKQPKLLFDECIGRPHIDRLKSLVELDNENRPEIKHILDFQGEGVRDEDWVPRIANEGWIIITADRGAKGMKKGEKLPRLCTEWGVSHVLLSRRVGQRKSFEKMLTILSVWFDLLSLSEKPRGVRFQLEPASNDPLDRARGKLIDRTPDPRPTPPGQLFDPNR